MNNTTSYSGNYHGFLPGLFSPVTSLIGKGINGLRNIIKENRGCSITNASSIANAIADNF